jgi:hypothetical protein
MNRYYSFLQKPWNAIFSLVIIRIIHLPAIIGLILCIVGATNANTPRQIEHESTVHIGIVLFAVVLAMLTVLTVGAWIRTRQTREGEDVLALAVLCALPFLFIRMAYALLAVFSKSKVFSLGSVSTGSETAALFMSVLTEVAVVLIYLATGSRLRAVPEGATNTPAQELPYRAGRGDLGTGRLGIFSLASSVFQVRGRRDETQERHQTLEK